MSLCAFRSRSDNHAHQRRVCAHVETRVDNAKVGVAVVIDATHEYYRFKAWQAVNQCDPLTFIQRMECLLVNHD
jgi:hypothetical protein